ncbi:DNA-binding transcriptional LysR family regulator [Catenuloplanes nepalensis]|uniref:DNA-binding transcriptional LysR family regulator n=1 Tax=Catenuloplanes nepalensis TaxID=587533 RepID=A0ABT9MQA5_9ACTN|nr:LysR family transcriptional regulator [Catenuloplanes nepalensis]MDP9793592.1 DNA-binding transcriptional LysR family regulator [Catenuloplanes nepalensis]
MDLDLLGTFLDVYRTGSLSAAATAGGVSQPAVSGRLARLEERVGEPLFDRTPRGVSPTARADDLARRIAPHLDALRGAVRTDGGPEAPEPLGTVHLAGPAELMSLRVLPALGPLIAQGLSVRASFGLAEDLLAALLRCEHDLVVSAIRPTARSLRATPLIDEQFVLVATPALARTVEAALITVDPITALAHLPLVAYAEDLPIIRRYWRSEFGRRPPNRVVLTVPDLRAVLSAVVAGVGASVLPRYLAEPAMASGSVIQLHRSMIEPLNTLYLVTKLGYTEPSAERVHAHLLDHARQWGSL